MKLQSPSDLARVVKNARTKINLTQQDVANAVGITRQSLARIERGNGGASFDTIIAILDHLNVDLEARPTAQSAPPKAAAAHNPALTAAAELAQRIAPPLPTNFLSPFRENVMKSVNASVSYSTLPAIQGLDAKKRTAPGPNIEPGTDGDSE